MRCEARLPCCNGRDEHGHHRKLRSRGGSDGPPNEIRVCFACHDWIHAHPARSTELGLMIPSWGDESTLVDYEAIRLMHR